MRAREREERGTVTEREGDRNTEKEGQRQRETEGERQGEGDRERQKERYRDRETETVIEGEEPDVGGDGGVVEAVAGLGETRQRSPWHAVGTLTSTLYLAIGLRENSQQKTHFAQSQMDHG